MSDLDLVNQLTNRLALEAMPATISRFIKRTGRGGTHSSSIWSIDTQGHNDEYRASMVLLGLRLEDECYYTPPKDEAVLGFLVAGLLWINVRDVHLHLEDIGYVAR